MQKQPQEEGEGKTKGEEKFVTWKEVDHQPPGNPSIFGKELKSDSSTFQGSLFLRVDGQKRSLESDQPRKQVKAQHS